jgi:antitoxin (DNA-binding transcriptional repressor) of toxin-antitoxin stability system
MISVSLEKVRDQFPAFLSKVESGEEIILEKGGEPIARVVPIKKKGKRILGKERGKIWMSDDFDEPLPEEILAEFYK